MKKQDKSNEEPVSELEELSQSFPLDLRKSEERYRNIIEAIEDGYYEVDIKGNTTFFNNSYCEIMGYPGGELPGMNYRNYMDEPTAKKTYEVFNGVYRTGKAVKVYDYQIIRKDGTIRTCSISVSLMKNDEGQPCGFRGIFARHNRPQASWGGPTRERGALSRYGREHRRSHLHTRPAGQTSLCEPGASQSLGICPRRTGRNRSSLLFGPRSATPV